MLNVHVHAVSVYINGDASTIIIDKVHTVHNGVALIIIVEPPCLESAR